MILVQQISKQLPFQFSFPSMWIQPWLFCLPTIAFCGAKKVEQRTAKITYLWVFLTNLTTIGIFALELLSYSHKQQWSFSLTFSLYSNLLNSVARDALIEAVVSIRRKLTRSSSLSMKISTRDLSLFCMFDMHRYCQPFSWRWHTLLEFQCSTH